MLIYHSIQGRGSCGSDSEYEVREEDFENQMHFLLENGYTSHLFKDVITSTNMPVKGIVITFDDGHLSNYTIAFPILLKYGFKAEFFVSSRQIAGKDRMTVQHLKVMVDNGMSIGSHGITHLYLDDLDDLDAKKELQQSKEDIENLIGKPVISFSAPGGRFRARHVQFALDCGYQVFCTSRPGFIKSQASLRNVPRISVRQSNVSYFKDIAMGNDLYYFKKRITASSLRMAKKNLGNKRYEFIRSYLLNKR